MGANFEKSCFTLREVQNYLAGEEFEHLRNKLESDRICNRGFWEKNVQQENRFFRVLDLLIYLGVETDKNDAIVEKTECQTEKANSFVHQFLSKMKNKIEIGNFKIYTVKSDSFMEMIDYYSRCTGGINGKLWLDWVMEMVYSIRYP